MNRLLVIETLSDGFKILVYVAEGTMKALSEDINWFRKNHPDFEQRIEKIKKIK